MDRRKMTVSAKELARGLPTVEDLDWQAVRSWDRPEGLQLIERCAGCGAGRNTITAHDTREYRIISVYPDPLPGHCSGATGDGRGGLT